MLLNDMLKVGIPHWCFFGLLLSFVFRIALELRWRFGEALSLRMMRADHAFSDASPGLTEYPVEIVVEAEGVCMGADRGFVWFEDGILTFNGSACSFALSADDLYPRRKIDGKDPYYGLPADALRLRAMGRVATVRFLPLLGRHRLGFEYALGRFLASESTSDRSRQWPPLIHYNDVPKVAARRLETPEAIGIEASRTGSAMGVVRNRP